MRAHRCRQNFPVHGIMTCFAKLSFGIVLRSTFLVNQGARDITGITDNHLLRGANNTEALRKGHTRRFMRRSKLCKKIHFVIFCLIPMMNNIHNFSVLRMIFSCPKMVFFSLLSILPCYLYCVKSQINYFLLSEQQLEGNLELLQCKRFCLVDCLDLNQ